MIGLSSSTVGIQFCMSGEYLFAINYIWEEFKTLVVYEGKFLSLKSV